MLGWTFRKNGPALTTLTGAGLADVSATPPKTAGPPEGSQTDWAAQLQLARGDDAVLLSLTRSSAPLAIKLEAIGALVGEAALRQAEREFRTHDRRVHQLAKQRHGALVSRREAGAQAAQLIASARALIDAPVLPVNRLVELDRAWQALDADSIDGGQLAEFAALTSRLVTVARQRADCEVAIKRWNAEALLALNDLRAAGTEAAAGIRDRGALAKAMAFARSVAEAGPDGQDMAPLQDALNSATELDGHLEVLERLLRDPLLVDGATPAADETALAAEDVATPPMLDQVLQWQQLAPLRQSDLADLLNRRFQQWKQSQASAAQALFAQRRELARQQRRAAQSDLAQALVGALDQTQAALDDGHLAAAHRHLVEIDEMLQGAEATGALRTRIAAVQARYSQLKGWQHWAGGRARADLTLQAEALAAVTGGKVGVDIAKLSIKQRAELIDELRERWKELDRLGGATSRALWLRFDSVLKAAYEPVAAHLAAQRAAREQNLAGRQQLINELELVPLAAVNGEGSTHDFRLLAAALDQFQVQWRKLGPLEHTVPRKSHDVLAERMAAAVRRLEEPLQQARHRARLERERLVARARMLGAEASSRAQGRNQTDEVRGLQAEWQQHARGLPLTRGDEAALWAEFKAATDAIFSARKLAFWARDAELCANGAERAALIERLETLADVPPAEWRRVIAEVEAHWSRCGPAPHADAAALEARFRHAREQARQWEHAAEQRSWHDICDALVAKLELCDALECSDDPDSARGALDQLWPTLEALPRTWDAALRLRAKLSAPDRDATSKAVPVSEDPLLQLEVAWDLASPPEFADARRELKLQSMKDALQSRASKAAPMTPSDWLVAALWRPAIDAAQRERRGAVVAALRLRGPIGSDGGGR